MLDYVLNGVGHGDIGQALGGTNFDPGMLRPYFNERNKRCVTINTGRKVLDNKTGKLVTVYKEVDIDVLTSQGIYHPVWNATSLRKDEWIEYDTAATLSSRERLKAYAHLAAANTYGGFDGMSKMTLEHETMSDPGEAIVDMDGLTPGRGDMPLFQLEAIPLPIIHSGFTVSKRKMGVSLSGGSPIDTTMAEVSGRRVAETIEKLTIGTETGVTYGAKPTGARQNSQIFGYTNFPDRNTKTNMTAPDGTNGTTVLTEWLALRKLLIDDKYFGPYRAYVSSGYEEKMDDEFKTNSDKSLRERLLAIDGITSIDVLDFLTTANVVILVQMTSDVARAINGMDITTVQWETHGGMQLHFKVMAIQIPHIRADHSGNCGIAHGTTS